MADVVCFGVSCWSLPPLLCHAAPAAAWRHTAEPLLDERWQRCLEAAVGRSSTSGRLELPAEQPVPKLGWEGATGFWDGSPLRAELRILNNIQRFNRGCEAAATGTTEEAHAGYL